VHVCLTQKVADGSNLFKTLLSQKKLVGKMKTLLECNIDFSLWQDNVFAASAVNYGNGHFSDLGLHQIVFP